jgi:hypothetical protein
MMDWQRRSVQCEVQVQETTRDVCFLHNETFFAAAQKKWVGVPVWVVLILLRPRERGWACLSG